MDRIALAKRLEGLSRVFIAGSPYHRDLKAMSEVLARVDDEKFATILDAEFTADKEGAVFGMPAPGYQQQERRTAPGRGMEERSPGSAPGSRTVSDPMFAQRVFKEFGLPIDQIGEAIREYRKTKGIEKLTPEKTPAGVQQPAGQQPAGTRMEASDKDVGLFWNREASEAIQNNLLRDVVGMTKTQIEDTHRHLDKDQVPDGTHDGEKASNLKPEQTPKLSDVLDSGIVQKSHGAVKKEAAAEEDDKKDDKKDDKAAAEKPKAEEEDKDAGKKELSPSEQAALAKAKENVEEGSKKTEKGLKEVKKLAPSDKPKADKPAPEADKPDDKKEAGLVEGIELTAPMDDVILDAAEQEKLSKLFA